MKQYLNLNTKLENYLADDFTIPVTPDDFNRHKYLTSIDSGNKQVGLSKDPHWWVFNFHDSSTKMSDILSQELIELLQDKDIEIGTMWIFFYPNENANIGKIHCDWGFNDPERRQNNYSVNWVVSPHQDHSMIWYRPIIEGEMFTNYVTNPIWHDKNDVLEIDRVTIDDLTLVRTNIPHNGENYGTGARWTFSLKPSKMYPTWEDTLSSYKSKFNIGAST